MAVKLPAEDPSGEQFEDLVGAVLRSRGYFTESRLVLKGDSREVLELDVVATPSGDHFESPLLVEAKRGRYSFGNVFKLFGQRVYLGIPEARLVHWEDVEETHRVDFDRVGEDTLVRCCTLRVDEDYYDPEGLADAAVELDEDTEGKLMMQAWFQLIGARVAFAAFMDHFRAHRDQEEFTKARAYDLAIRRAFFEPAPIDRVRALYQAWSEAPRISGELVTWQAEREGKTERSVWNQVNDTAQLPWLQYVMLLEHRARLGVIKNALQHGLSRDGTEGWDFLDILTTPQSFQSGMDQLRDYEFRTAVPFALQLFVESFGGFLFEEDEDRELFATCAGIPTTEIDTVLGFMDQFFPFGDSSWYYSIQDRILAMKVIPGMLRGSGAFLRRSLHDLADYGQHYPDFGWLAGKWHSALYGVVKPELGA